MKSADFEASVARAREALLAKGVEAAATADINTLATLAEKHGTGAYNPTDVAGSWDRAFAAAGIKTKRQIERRPK